MIENVVALYVDPDGPYPTLVRDWYDEQRDARSYSGPHPVVCHPPCGPWGRLRFLCKHQDPSAGPHGVSMVRTFGGVLEHPADSRLWRHCHMPFPGELPDEWGGRTYALRQVSWGHVCEKPTWLYTVRVDWRDVLYGLRSGGIATRRVTSGPGGPQLPAATKEARRRSPPEFARWLVELAGTVRS